jgi:serine/threonine protein kinase
MSNSPDSGHRNQENRSTNRYQTIRELGLNREGGRITYLATDVKTQQPVVIKRFLFAQAGASWSDYKAYEREIQVLKELNHFGQSRRTIVNRTASISMGRGLIVLIVAY